MTPKTIERSQEIDVKATWGTDAEVGAWFAELYRSLIAQGCGEDSAPVIGITSFRSGEGVSTVASQLALAAANSGERKVLLVHANPETATVDRTGAFGREPGFVDVMRGSQSLEQAVQGTTLDNLWALPPGSACEERSDEWRARVRETLDAMAVEYSLVIVDLAPVDRPDQVDGLIGNIDGIVLVVEANGTRRSHALAGADALADARILGVVMNKR